ncbi:MAG: hypothetical protein GF315_10470 [candidate division Zixibacteria bacterium]|nr:hypothetical protein [candidate division Zixibacteria bacterium]
MRREIPLILTAFVGFTYILQFFIPHAPFNQLDRMLNEWIQVIAAFAIWLGALNLMKVSLNKVSRQSENWPFALITIFGFLLTVIVGLFLSGGRGYQSPGTGFDYIYRNIYAPLSSTMFATLAFYVGSASYRAFRARTKEATMLLLAAFFVMLGRVPIGDYITAFLPKGYRLSDFATWIMNYPQTAGYRAIMIGIALGIVSMSLRIILGIERSHLGGEE